MGFVESQILIGNLLHSVYSEPKLSPVRKGQIIGNWVDKGIILQIPIKVGLSYRSQLYDVSRRAPILWPSEMGQ